MHSPRWALALLVVSGTTPLIAQESPRRAARDTVVELPAMTVTATRDLREVFRTPTPVSVVDSTTLARRAPASITDLFLDLPGLDVNGVGPSQSRPIIRGLLGQRILLLQDGIRMNNSRRESDFGEIPSLVGLEALGRVEVVRGPTSVLYGTDAIGGAVNLITRQPSTSITGSSVHGSFGYRYQSAGNSQRPFGLVTGQVGRLNWLAFGSYRDATDYTAPAGTFGKLPLPNDSKVQDSGVKDQNYAFQLGYGLTANSSLHARYDRYTADNAGFGYVDNADLQRPNDPTIAIRYPNQGVDRLSLGYTNRGVRSALADRIDVTTYYVDNTRRLTFDITIPTGPGSQGQIGIRNFTDLQTFGFRIEAGKAIGNVVLTYGFDGFHDRSNNTDTTTTTGFGPPSTDPVSKTPNASFRSLGGFLQSDFHLAPRLILIAGLRVQDIKASTRSTPNVTAPLVSHSNATVVGTVNTEYLLSDNLSVIGTVGRGFRSANLIERFFNGLAPEGGGFQVRTPNLKPETSLNVDVGLRYRSQLLQLEAFAFRNEITDAIVLQPTGDSTAIGPGQYAQNFSNVNIGKLRYLGLEASGRVVVGHGFSTAANVTVTDTKDVRDPSNPVAQSYGFRVGGEARYDHPSGRFWLAYGARHNGEQKDVANSQSPIGTPLPAFTVMTARAGAQLFRAGRTSHSVTATLDNVGNKLYSEASSSSALFRPSPGRNVTLAYRMDF
ncbi:MAG: TonB-dependent receptor [Gemmatimonadota bacterium]